MARLWHGVNRALWDDGVRWSYSRISLYSRKSVQSHEKLGARGVGVVAFLVLGPLQLSLGPRRWHLRLSTGAHDIPVIHLPPPPPAA